MKKIPLFIFSLLYFVAIVAIAVVFGLMKGESLDSVSTLILCICSAFTGCINLVSWLLAATMASESKDK
jgi:hypothetical protein